MTAQDPVLNFVMALQSIKKSQLAWATSPISQRLLHLQKFLEILKSEKQNLAQKISESEGISIAEALALQVEAGVALIEQAFFEVSSLPVEEFGSPSGIFLFMPPPVFSFRWLCEKAIRAWLAGNAIVILAQSTGCAAALFTDLWNKACAEVNPQKDLLHAFYRSSGVKTDALDSVEEVFIAHPAFRGIAGAGLAAQKIEAIVRGSASTLKKLQLAGLGNNSALVLSDVNLNIATEEIVRAVTTAAGATPWAINKVFVLESQLKAFEEQLKIKLQTATSVNVAVADNDRLQAVYAQALSDNGRHFSGVYPEPLVISDLSHCSTLQQDALQAPILFLLPVKYQHEMLKWANTGYLGLCNFVFGSEEKIQKVASRLESGVVIGNRWLHTNFSDEKHQAEAWPLGVKQSFYGISDSRVFGDFFSERRIFNV